MKTKFLKGVIGRESAEGSSTSAVALLCRALRQHDLIAPVLFQAHAAEEIYARGDVISVKRTATHSAHAAAIVLGTTVVRDTLSYVTTDGGPFNALHCKLVCRADGVSTELADDAEAWSPSPAQKVRADRKSNVVLTDEFKKVRALVKSEFKYSNLSKSKGLSEFLAGRVTMAEAFAHNAEKYVLGSREFEMGENIGGALEDHFEMFGSGDEVFSADLTDDVMRMKLDEFVTWIIGAAKAHKDKLEKAKNDVQEIDDALASGEYFDKSSIKTKTAKPAKKIDKDGRVGADWSEEERASDSADNDW